MSDNIVLAGFMASGKTTVGGILSERTGRELVDTDAMVEESSGITIRELFASTGEEAFREMEAEQVRRGAARDGVILSVGGGAVLDPGNVAALKKTGVVYLLDVGAAEAVRRCGSGRCRPLMEPGPEAMEALLVKRRAAYLAAADVVVPTEGRSPEQVAERILADFNARHGGGLEG